MREWLEQLEAEEDPIVPLAFLAAQLVEIDEEELNGALRRTVFIVAAGGDPHRALELDSRGVTALAAELDQAERRADLDNALAVLHEQAAGLPRMEATIQALRTDGDRAWRAFAAALLAGELAEQS